MSKSKTQLKKLSKDELESYGRTIGIELDRRLVKKKLIEQLIEHQNSPEGDAVKTPKVIKDAVSKVKETVAKVAGKTAGHVLLRDASTGAWSSGPKPKGKTQSGTSRGEPFWEI
jgi:hypothetical protein